MFKIGDWVRLKYSYGYEKPNKIIEIYENTVLLNTNLYPSSDNIWYIKDITAWQPKEGEWCWFYDSEYPLSYILCKFETFDNGFWCRPNFSDTIERFNGCEPFIDELPSFLKENR